MDVSPSGIRKVQFREKLRGYHPEDVDAFVAEVANRVQALEQQVEALTTRVTEAEGRASESTGSEDQLRRTLVLAQRTADLAVQEAREEANRLLSEAQAEREAVLAEASAARQQAIEEARHTATDELARYAEAREQLAADVRALDEYVREQRSRIVSALSEAQETVAQGSYLTQPPELHDVQVPPPGDDPAPEVEVDDPGGPADITPAVTEVGEPGDDQPERAAALPDDDDPFITELRRAVTDTEPLGPRDRSEPAAEGREMFEDDSDGGRSRLPWRR